MKHYFSENKNFYFEESKPDPNSQFITFYVFKLCEWFQQKQYPQKKLTVHIHKDTWKINFNDMTCTSSDDLLMIINESLLLKDKLKDLSAFR